MTRLRAAAQFRLANLWRNQIVPGARRYRNANRSFEPVFIAGAMGSGTTLLALALGQRFDVAGVITESARQISRRSPLWVDATEAFPSIRAYQDVIDEVDGTPAALREDLLGLYRSRAAYSGAVILDKGPNTNLVRADLLAQLFPSAPFVLIFRDPVSNIEGFRRKWSSFERDSLEESIRFYAEIHTGFLDLAEARGLRLHVVEYESLVQDLEPTLDCIGAKLGLARATGLRPLDDRPDVGVRGIRRVRGSSIHVEQGATTKSTASLEHAQVELIRHRLGDLHTRLREAAGSPVQGEKRVG